MRNFLSGPKKKDHTHYFDTLWFMPRSRHAGGLRGHRDRMLGSDSKVGGEGILGFSEHHGYFELQQFIQSSVTWWLSLTTFTPHTCSKSDLSLDEKLSVRTPKSQVK